jgi:hypothetical protein
VKKKNTPGCGRAGRGVAGVMKWPAPVQMGVFFFLEEHKRTYCSDAAIDPIQKDRKFS